MEEASQEHPGKLRHKARRRRHRSRPSLLKRLLQPVGIEIRAMLRSPVYRWSLAAGVILLLLVWLVGGLLPSSRSNRSPASPLGLVTR